MVISMVPVFPPEIWLIIVDHLRGEDNPQHISRLSQTCRWLYQEINHLIYRSVRLNWEMNVLGFGQTVFNRPQLAGLVKQVRYAIDMGSNSFTSRYSPFYKLLPRLYNLRTLNLRKDFYPDEKTNIRTRSKDLLDGLLDGKGLSQVRRDGCVQLSKTFKDVTKGGNHSRLERAAFISAGELFLKYHTAGSYMDDVTICLRCDQGGLKDLIPALRTCHIGTNSVYPGQNKRHETIEFNESIFTLPYLEKLCITGALFRKLRSPVQLPPGCGKNLKELLILNCRLSPKDLGYIVQFPRALSRLTLRIPITLLVENEEDSYINFTLDLAQFHHASLEYLDLDIYEGAREGVILGALPNLKEATITPYSMYGYFRMYTFLPESLQRLTLRFEEGSDLPLKDLLDALETDRLPNLRTILCHIPDNIYGAPDSAEIRRDVETLKSCFKDFGVDLSAELVPYPDTMPKYDVCPCENLHAFHRFPVHPRAHHRERRPYEPITFTSTIADWVSDDGSVPSSANWDTGSDQGSDEDEDDANLNANLDGYNNRDIDALSNGDSDTYSDDPNMRPMSPLDYADYEDHFEEQ